MILSIKMINLSKKIIKKNYQDHINILRKQEKYFLKTCNEISDKIVSRISKQGKLIICGNGGSAADAQHIATELMVRLKKNGTPIPSIALTTDSSILTATSNDLSFYKIFSRQLEAISQKNDILLAISTSGNSLNVIEALKVSKKKKLLSIGLLGNKGGKCKKLCDSSFIVDSNNPSRVQEIHILFYHSMCEIIENKFRK